MPHCDGREEDCGACSLDAMCSWSHDVASNTPSGYMWSCSPTAHSWHKDPATGHIVYECDDATANTEEADVQDSSLKSIRTSGKDALCVDLPGGDLFNGNLLWLWECNGMDSQNWVVDNNQLRYGANESFCIDARDVSDGTQLMLWECNGSDQQNWGYDADASKMYLPSVGDEGSSACLDFWDNQPYNGQFAHIWQCNDQDNQKWSLVDAVPAPAPAPWAPPAPAPVPAPAPWTGSTTPAPLAPAPAPLAPAPAPLAPAPAPLAPALAPSPSPAPASDPADPPGFLGRQVV